MLRQPQSQQHLLPASCHSTAFAAGNTVYNIYAEGALGNHDIIYDMRSHKTFEREEATANSMPQRQNVFRLMDLPPELRELIYYHTMSPITPIDTAAIPNTPDHVPVHAVAQLSRQTRDEALHILHNSRPVEISLHSPENRRRALLWAAHWQQHARALPQLIFSGRITRHQLEFFHITVNISDEEPYFAARAKRAASAGSNVFVEKLTIAVDLWLTSQLEWVREGRSGKLSGAALAELISLVAEAAEHKHAGDEHLFSSGKRLIIS